MDASQVSVAVVAATSSPPPVVPPVNFDALMVEFVAKVEQLQRSSNKPVHYIGLLPIAMRIVSAVPTLSGAEKRDLAMRIIRQWIANSTTPDNKEAMDQLLAAIDYLGPSVIDTLFAEMPDLFRKAKKWCVASCCRSSKK